MQSTFLEITQISELSPRNHLKPGAVWILPGAESKSESLLDIPACTFRFANELLNFPADFKQQEVLGSTSRRVVVCCTRQWGKSTLGAIKAVHHALIHPGSLILIASRTLPQAGELLQKAVGFAQELGLPRRRAPGYPESLLLPNGSRIIALPGRPDSTRGFSALSLLIVDEAAFVPDSLYQALRPMLATRRDATIWLLSTPNGRKGFFFDEWTSDNPAWSKFTATAPECDRIDDEFLEEERRLLGPVAFAREYMCEFNASGESFFEMDALEAATEPHTLAGMQYSGPPSARYYVGFDLGQRSSYSALVIIERVEVTTTERDPVSFAFKKETHFHLRKIEQFPLNMSYDDTARKLKALIHSLPRSAITLMVDATGVGQPFLDILRKHNLGVHMMAIAITSGGGLSYSSGIQRVPKRHLMQAANYLMTADCFRIEPGLLNYTLLQREMDAYRVRTSGSGHQTFITSSTDDLVMAFALAAWQARKFLPKP